MADLIKNTAESDFRARADRRIQQGRVVSVDAETQTAILDVGAFDAQGNAVYLYNVPYQPHTPPQPEDIVSLHYANVSPHSVGVSSGQLGGANGDGTIKNGSGVNSLKKTGSTALQGDVTLSAGSNITLNQTGQDIQIAASNTGLTVKEDGSSEGTGITSLNVSTGLSVSVSGSEATLTADGGSGSEGTTPFGGWVTQAVDYTVLSTDGVIRATASNITFTLPDASLHAGKCYVFYISGSLTNVVVEDGGGPIETLSTSLPRVMLVSTGSAWERCL